MQKLIALINSVFFKMKAGALYFAVFIGFLCCAIAFFFLLSLSLHSKINTNEIHKEKLRHDLNSAITYSLANSESFEFNAEKEVDLYSDGQSRVLVQKKRYGVYKTLFVECSWKQFTLSKSALTGENRDNGEAVGLYLADRQRYLSVGGKTVLSGTCYLPALGVRKAYIEGKGFAFDEIVQGTIKTSNNRLPPVDTNLFNYLADYLQGVPAETDSVYEMDDFSEIRHPFDKKTMFIQSEDVLRLRDCRIEGNIILYSGQGILIGKDVVIEDVMIFAPDIYIEPGFEGHIQAFASDTLVIGNGCNLKLPSFAAIINENMNNCYMKIEKNSTLAGGIFIYQDSKALKEPELYIDESVTIYGQVYCNGMVELKGDIYGSLYCNGFLLKTPSAYYENHLLNAKVDRKNLSKEFAGPDVLRDKKSVGRVIKWL